jgi:hypothetical protein
VEPARIEREARRLLDRYLTEVVERFGLCPWAEPARRRGELRVEVVLAEEAVADAVTRIALDDRATIAMVVLAASSITPVALRRLRDASMRPDVAIADFHPDGAGDLASPARLVQLLRRSPDPMLQVVRWSVLEAARKAPPPPDRAAQARLLAGAPDAPHEPVADAIARANHAAVSAAGVRALLDVLDDLARDRARAYPRAYQG